MEQYGLLMKMTTSLFWRQLRRELVREGYRSSVLHKHKGLLKDYVEELGR